MATVLDVLRMELVSLAPSKRGRRYSPELRRRIGSVAARQLADGRSLSWLAQALGMAPQTLLSMLPRGTSASVALVPVEVKGAPMAVVEPQPAAIVVRGPRGLLIEGLDVKGVAALVRALS